MCGGDGPLGGVVVDELSKDVMDIIYINSLALASNSCTGTRPPRCHSRLRSSACRQADAPLSSVNAAAADYGGGLG